MKTEQTQTIDYTRDWIVELQKALASLKITFDSKDIDLDSDKSEKIELQQKMW